MTGADLEYAAMLARAGIVNPQGYDAPILEQMADARTERFPWNISSKKVTNLNTIDETGLVWCDGASTTGAPEATSSWRVHTERYSVNTAIQNSYSPALDRAYQRRKTTGTWGSWVRTHQTRTELDGRYKKIGDLVTDAELPARLKESHISDVPGNDWNNATASGQYAALDAANAPTATGWYLTEVEAHTANWVTHTAHAFTSDGSSDTKTYRRERNNGTWTEWYRLRTSEIELDARYLTYIATKTATDLPGTYPVGVSMFNTEDASWPRSLGSVLSAIRTNARGFQVFTSTTGESFIRSAHTSFESGWSPWTYFGGDSGWIAPTLQNSWVNFGAGETVAGYRKIGNRVFLQGLIKSGVTTSGTDIFILPVGYRPPANHYFASTASGPAAAQIAISSTGTVKFMAGSATWTSLSGISFTVD